MGIWKALLLAAIVCGLFIWHQWPRSLPEPAALSADPHPDSRRQLAQGTAVGISHRNNTFAWLGIPYARPPVGELRWRAPLPGKAFAEPLLANRYGSFCSQIAGQMVDVERQQWGRPAGSEDCLYLNIWSPAFTAAALPRGRQRLPVMVWIHGGGNSAGASDGYDLSALAGQHKLITVSLNYRLGPLGWFSHTALRDRAASAEDASGNYGILDIVRALQWLQDNVAAFGGDPGNVTVFGESAGGANIAALLVSPKAAGLFHRAIIQSGSLRSTSLAAAENAADAEIPGHAGSSTELLLTLLAGEQQPPDPEAARRQLEKMSGSDIAAYLRAKTAGEILRAYKPLVGGMLHIPTLIGDGEVLPRQNFAEVLATPGAYNAVPLITGANRDEMKLFMFLSPRYAERRYGLLLRARDAALYQRRARYLSDDWRARSVHELAAQLARAGNRRVYAYRFDWDEQANSIFAPIDTMLGAAHGMEIPFVINHFEGLFNKPGVFTAATRSSRETLSQAMMSYWAAFARHGAPGRGSDTQLPAWQAWSGEGGQAGQAIVFDTPRDGGIRMITEQLSVQTLKQRLQRDGDIASREERCGYYALLYRGTPQWNQQEYLNLGREGCGDIDPALYVRL